MQYYETHVLTVLAFGQKYANLITENRAIQFNKLHNIMVKSALDSVSVI